MKTDPAGNAVVFKSLTPARIQENALPPGMFLVANWMHFSRTTGKDVVCTAFACFDKQVARSSTAVTDNIHNCSTGTRLNGQATKNCIGHRSNYG